MDTKYALQEYYVEYLFDVRRLKKSSVNHYLDAIRWVSRYLKERNLLQDSLYEIPDLNRLEELNTILRSDPEFMEMNRRGHQMYTAGMNNYLKFAQGEKFETIDKQAGILDMPMPVPEQIILNGQLKWKRSGIIKDQTITSAHYLCEIDNTHQTFISESTGHQYMEGHHAIPLNKQGRFNNSLDIYANIVCVCPICHRLLHYGELMQKENVLGKIYQQRSERLVKSGIRLSHDEFITMAIK